MFAVILIEHIIPRFGLPRTLQSDNGPAFIFSIIQVSESLNITWKLHIPYQPQSSGLSRQKDICQRHVTLSKPKLVGGNRNQPLWDFPTPNL
uniref:Integrase catalytic domain-containing protein n=1 Tax=Mustela putorius furo TaxID=9669 RepID=M3Y092_MUSPF